MSDNIPLDIQSEIMKRLPIKSLLQFRSVSKQWKSIIDSSKFIKNYHRNHTNPQHHLLVRYKLNNVHTYTSITDNNTFPQQKLPLSAPESLSSLTHSSTLGSVNGLIGFYGYRNETSGIQTEVAVIWNPSIRKSVSVVIPNALYRSRVVGFGVSPGTSDPTVVKISVVEEPSSSMWVVEVFALSRRVWEIVCMDAPFKQCDLVWIQVSIGGVIYWRAYDDIDLDDGIRSNFIISFDLESNKFGEVCLPDRLVYTPLLLLANMNESLVLLECIDEEGEPSVCGVWMRKDGENKPFTKIYNVKVEGSYYTSTILGFRKNGEALLELRDVSSEETEIDVYEPMSGRISSVGIAGKYAMFHVRSYMETLLLLDEPNTIIHSSQ